MGQYNPHAPFIIGNELALIRDEDLVFSPSVNSEERGTSFNLLAATRIRDGRFYVHEMPDQIAFYEVVQLGLYPINNVSESGPIQQVIIPVSNVTTTGATIGVQGANATDALYLPGDNKYLYFPKPAGSPNANAGTISCYFKANDYPYLNGKRILNVSLLYRGSVQDGSGITGGPFEFVNPLTAAVTVVSQVNDAGVGQQFSPLAVGSATGTLTLNTKLGPAAFSLQEAVTNVLNLGDVNNCWDSTAPAATNEKLPWLYSDLQRFEFGGANRQHIEIRFNLPETAIGTVSAIGYLDYVALRVVYCEETRIAYGAQQCQYSYGMNRITIRDLAHNTDPVIPIGTYVPTISAVSMGQVGQGFGLTGVFPKLNATRQLYELPSHQSVQLHLPFPPENRIGDVFTTEQVDVLPQLSFHTSGATLNEPQVFGRQAVAQVFGSITATQEILDSAAGAATTWPQVRYYARRFGDTTVPLLLDSPTITGAGRSVTLTPAEWDALPELIDGWKEITKRFVSPPTMGAGTSPQWRWSAIGEAVSSRWEVLGAAAPAISGVPSTFLTQVPTAQRLTTATYGQPAAGSTINEGWVPGLSPQVTTTTDDPFSDATLIFSQDPAQITGLVVSTLSQAVTGFTNCTKSPCCIPTAIQYNRVTWSLPNGTGAASDSFNRVTANGLGTPDTGGSYTTTGAASQYATDGTRALITPAAAGTDAIATLSVGVNFEATATVGILASVISGGTGRVGLVGRYVDASNFYFAEIDVDNTSGTPGTATLFLSKRVGGSFIDVGPPAGIPLPFTTNSGGTAVIRLTIVGSVLKVKAYPLGTNPDDTPWLIEATDTSHTTGTRVGLYANNLTVNGNTQTFDNFVVTPPSFWFGGYELQRLDVVDNVWQTIMLATSPAVTGFSDYEARVGVQSSYQLRQLNDLAFAGPWSITGTATIAEPGVTLPSCGTNKRGVLIFTSNDNQAGLYNLAYAMTWDGQVVEDFGFIEAGSVDIQQYHDRDYQVAFHGSERGGEQFSRRLLTANAAVALPRLANVRSLRDMAWADLPYVCVRDDIGDRWYATVIVPGNAVRRNRKLYNVDITVVEVTATPAVVDPS